MCVHIIYCKQVVKPINLLWKKHNVQLRRCGNFKGCMLCNLLLRRLNEELKPTASESSKQIGINETIERDQYVTSFFTQVRTRVITRSSNRTVSLLTDVSIFPSISCPYLLYSVYHLHVANVLLYTLSDTCGILTLNWVIITNA